MCGPIDWSATGGMLQGWGSILGAVAIMVAAWLGSQTFKAWRLQNVSERRVKQAERILTATYQARRHLAAVRSPMMWASETDRGKDTLVEKDLWNVISGEAAQKKAAVAQAYYHRLNRTQDVQNELEHCLPMARALFGEKLELALASLKHHFWTVEVYVGANQRDKDDPDKNFRKKIEQTIWSGYPSKEENYLDVEIEADIQIIEDTCLPALRLDTPNSQSGTRR